MKRNLKRKIITRFKHNNGDIDSCSYAGLNRYPETVQIKLDDEIIILDLLGYGTEEIRITFETEKQFNEINKRIAQVADAKLGIHYDCS